MSVMTAKQLTSKITGLGKRANTFADDVQEVLISCAFYAIKDGNTTPANDLLDAIEGPTRIKGITMWLELYAPVHVKEGRIALSKGAAKQYDVKSEADFTEFEKEMRDSPRWDTIVGKEARVSIWDAGKKIDSLVKQLKEHGEAGLAEALRNAEIAYRAQHNNVTESV